MNKIDCRYYVNTSREIIDEKNHVVYIVKGVCILHNRVGYACPNICPFYSSNK